MAESLWGDVAAAYDASFASLCAGATPALLDLVRPGARVLEVGCGPGLLAAELAARGVDVTACDPDPGMVALAAARLDTAPVLAGLPSLPWADGTFDVVVASFVLNHVDEPLAGAAELARVLRSGGRLLATIWPGRPAPQAEPWGALMASVGAVPPALPRLPEDKDFERSPDGLAGLLGDAGLAAATGREVAWRWRVAPADYWAGVTHVGNFGVTWRAQPEDVQRRMEAGFGEAVAPWLVGDRLEFAVECVLAEAVRP